MASRFSMDREIDVILIAYVDFEVHSRSSIACLSLFFYDISFLSTYGGKNVERKRKEKWDFFFEFKCI